MQSLTRILYSLCASCGGLQPDGLQERVEVGDNLLVQMIESIAPGVRDLFDEAFGSEL